jgi:NADH pyrophosphatase NudC (nudix superfamily)
MRFVGGDFSDHDHEMEDAAWFEPDEARRRMSFANERKLLELIPDVLAAQGAGGS